MISSLWELTSPGCGQGACLHSSSIFPGLRFFPFDGLCSCTCTVMPQVFFQTELAAGRKDAGDQMAQRIRRQLCRALKTLEPMVGEGSRYTSAFSALRALTTLRALVAVRHPHIVLEPACRMGICRTVVTRNLVPSKRALRHTRRLG